MSAIRNKKGHEVGNKQGIFPTSSDKGSDLASENIDGVDVVVMNGLGLGIYNGNTADITIEVILAGDDATSSIPYTIAGGSSWQGGFFNAVAVTGSTGHLDSTTRYLYA